MDRWTRLTEGLNRDQKLIEVGASSSPVIPKRDGWKSQVVDHVTREDFIEKYSCTEEQAKRIEAVDVVWTGGALHAQLPPSEHGSYDGIVASHVLEHLPDPVSFLKSCYVLLKPRGRVILALPDKRRCFDFFGNLSTTGDLLENYLDARTTHTPRAAFNEVAYAVTNNGAIGWGAGQKPDFAFVHSIERARGCAERAKNRPLQYFDHHGWRFVPSSFALIILELTILGYLNMKIERLSELHSQEFFVDLVKEHATLPSPDALSSQRMALLKENLRSMVLQLEEMGE